MIVVDRYADTNAEYMVWAKYSPHVTISFQCWCSKFQHQLVLDGCLLVLPPSKWQKAGVGNWRRWAGQVDELGWSVSQTVLHGVIPGAPMSAMCTVIESQHEN